MITITITSPEPDPKLTLSIDESYTLKINNNQIEITSATIYGFRHATETLYQLFEPNPTGIHITRLPINITDSPRFRYRGLMIDPSRNQLTPKHVPEIIESMSMLKLNVLHIHLTDAQQFTVEIQQFRIK